MGTHSLQEKGKNLVYLGYRYSKYVFCCCLKIARLREVRIAIA